MDFIRRHVRWVVIGTLAVLIASSYHVLFSAPATFEAGSIVNIARGTSAPQVAQVLFDAHVIRHPLLLRLALNISGTSNSVQAGAYLFERPQNVLMVAHRLTSGTYDLPSVRLTFTEGMTVRDAATEIANALPEISTQDFVKEAKPYEGYLFPDTYLLSPSSDAAEIVAIMRENFDTKIAALARNILASGRSLSDIVILASLLEKEARTSANRRIIAGILLNRLHLGMPLQVDAVFGYIFNRDTYSPSLSDLEVDSPYNTYTHIGLPPGPIDNPGLDALVDALEPTKTTYLYYLVDKNGVMHFATTFAAHQANQKKFLP
jgi:UPF0755 protein